jgi:8-oxo-dGTP pyrophosphatase MutT (NUDIX family)
MELNTLTINEPPRAAATVVVLRDGRPGLEVLLIQRHGRSEVLGGAHVFPGGKVDDADAAPDALALLDQSPDTLHGRLNEPELSSRAAAAIFVAAAREAFEESGILLAQGASAEQSLRARELLRSGLSFASVLATTGLVLAASALRPWSRWITPKMPSVMSKRFDTRFFVAAMPAHQTAQHDDHETTASLWVTPRNALNNYWARQIELAPPQIMSLVHLAQHNSVNSVLAAAATQVPPLVEPEPFEQEGTRVICYPGDPRHSVQARALPGPTRLIYRDRRFETDRGFDGFLDPSRAQSGVA